jgi:predicted MarR family transcription regulator
MALLGALCISLNVLGFTNRSLRAQVSSLLGADYSRNQASYDLARLRSNGLIYRIPHTNRYQLTADGQRIAIFYTKIYNRVLTPLTAADQPPAPAELRQPLAAIDRHLNGYIDPARFGLAA